MSEDENKPEPPKMPFTRQEIFSLSNGQILIQFPSHISAEDYEDFASWFEIFKRKIERSVESDDK